MENVKKLEALINKSANLQFTRIEEGENYYLYERMDISDGIPVKNYEVFRKVIKPVSGVLIKSERYKDFTHFESYPSDEEFGNWAWSCSTLERAKYIKALKSLY